MATYTEIQKIHKQIAETLFGASAQDGNLYADDGKPANKERLKGGKYE